MTFPVTWSLQGARHSMVAGGLAVWMARGDPLPQPRWASPPPPHKQNTKQRGSHPASWSSRCRGTEDWPVGQLQGGAMEAAPGKVQVRWGPGLGTSPGFDGLVLGFQDMVPV